VSFVVFASKARDWTSFFFYFFFSVVSVVLFSIPTLFDFNSCSLMPNFSFSPFFVLLCDLESVNAQVHNHLKLSLVPLLISVFSVSCVQFRAFLSPGGYFFLRRAIPPLGPPPFPQPLFFLLPFPLVPF